MPPLTADRDERLAALLVGLSDDRRAGRTPDPAVAAADHPDLLPELRDLWAVAQFADVARPTPRPTPPADAPPPDHVHLPRTFGDFELVEELGRGGMGVVYKAWQRSLSRTVALKMVREAHLATDADRVRFRTEAEAAARLKHPNIVTVHEVGTANGQAYFCMEYVEGPTLAQRLAADGPVPPREAARLMAVTARAVHYAHTQGIVHRDLKPANILLANPGPVPKVSDFGLAKRLDAGGNLTRTGAVVGTPSYMAPEQAAGRKDVGPAADVYALGVVLYELLTGRPPFRAAHPVDTMLLVLEQEPVPPRRLNPLVDRDLEQVCLKCLQKPPELRYASAGLLAADLEAYAAGEPISAQSSGLRFFLARLFRETHHADVLENWGRLWMWHSLMIFLLCLVTQLMAWNGVDQHIYYLGCWAGGLVTWATVLWQIRKAAGPVSFVERQIAHAWAAGVLASIGMFAIEWLVPLPALTLSPAVAVAAGMVMIFKAGILSGRFYIWAAANFAAAVVMPLVPRVGILLFGAVSALSFFLPGLKYHRQRAKNTATTG